MSPRRARGVLYHLSLTVFSQQGVAVLAGLGPPGGKLAFVSRYPQKDTRGIVDFPGLLGDPSRHAQPSKAPPAST